MKKIVMMMVMGLVAASYANVQVEWGAGAGFFWSPSGDALLSPGGSTIAQLMYSPDATQDAINTSKVGVNNDVIWSSMALTEGVNTSTYGDFAGTPFTQATTAGYVYALIFQDGNVQANDWYFKTAMVSVQDITGINPAQVIQLNTDLVNGDAINVAGPNNAQVVPEPATFLLFGIGGMGAWLIRRNKQQVKEEAEG